MLKWSGPARELPEEHGTIESVSRRALENRLRNARLKLTAPGLPREEAAPVATADWTDDRFHHYKFA